jgi:hypothetical protein
MRHPLVEAWEEQLEQAVRRVDAELERRHGTRYRLHPARSPVGSAANPRFDGLFSLTAAFTAGFGSRHGQGYVLDVGLITLEPVPPGERAALEREAIDLLRAELPRAFPDRRLTIESDGNTYKIVGDLRFHQTSTSANHVQ